MKGYIPLSAELARQTPGYRIRFYRTCAGLTQKQLADQCGLNESTIRNYELDNRTPDEKTLKKIAAELHTSYYALAETDLSVPEGAIHALFSLEKLYGIHPVMKGNNICLETDDTGKDSGLNEFFHEWFRQYKNLKSGIITEDAYLKWQSSFK